MSGAKWCGESGKFQSFFIYDAAPPERFGGGDFTCTVWPGAVRAAFERRVTGCVGESWYPVLKVTVSGPGQQSAGRVFPVGLAPTKLAELYFSLTVGAHRAAGRRSARTRLLTLVRETLPRAPHTEPPPPPGARKAHKSPSKVHPELQGAHLNKHRTSSSYLVPRNSYPQGADTPPACRQMLFPPHLVTHPLTLTVM